MKINIKVLPLREGVLLPFYATNGAAGADLHACIVDPVIIYANERRIIPAGFAMEMPEGYEAQIRSRSGIAIKHGVVVLNAPGTIDSDYRGEIAVMLVNLSNQPFKITNGDRIAQMVIKQVPQANFEWAVELDETKRGSGGFGSTGVSA